MEDDAVISRAEVTGLLFAVYDLLAELRRIRELLEGDDGEEEVQEDLE